MELCVNQHAYSYFGFVDSSLKEPKSPFPSLLSNIKEIFSSGRIFSSYIPREDSLVVDELECPKIEKKEKISEDSYLVSSNLSDFIEDGARRYCILNPGRTVNREIFQNAIENVSKFPQIQNPYIVFSDDSMNVVFFREKKRCSFQYYTDEPNMVAVSVSKEERIFIKDFDNDEISSIWDFCK